MALRLVYSKQVSKLEPQPSMTHLHLPSWWVRAFDASVLADLAGDGAMEQASAAALLPALAPLEMQALAMLLSDLQDQLLTAEPGARQRLAVSTRGHLKHLGTSTRSRRFMFERVIQLLGGLRLLRGDALGELSSYAPMAGDSWKEAAEGDFTVTFTLAPLGPELVLGWSDAHCDLLRLLHGEPQGVQLLGSAQPLVLSRSLWLELQGVEQLLHLRMERSVQWDFRWLQLEGIFGTALAELFHGISLPPQRGLGGSELLSQLKLLQRLGRKLVDHGSLKPAVEDHYLALGAADDPAPALIWQASLARLTAATGAQYRAAAGAALRRWHDAWMTPQLLKLYVPQDLPLAEHAAALELVRQLATTAAVPLAAGDCALELPGRGGQLLSMAGLFMELALRQLPGSCWPLPELLAVHTLAAFTKPAASSDLRQRFAGFCELLAASPELTEAFATVPLMTLTSPATQADGEFIARAKARLTTVYSQNEAVLAGPLEVKPRLIAPPATADATLAPRRAGATPASFASRMLKIAADELAKMRATDMERYQEIKRAYLATLDETSRRLLLDVQKRIQPSMFEEQLRQRLVRYMVDNPGAWRSAEGSKAGNP